MALMPSMEPVVEKAQHEPHCAHRHNKLSRLGQGTPMFLSKVKHHWLRSLRHNSQTSTREAVVPGSSIVTWAWFFTGVTVPFLRQSRLSGATAFSYMKEVLGSDKEFLKSGLQRGTVHSKAAQQEPSPPSLKRATTEVCWCERPGQQVSESCWGVQAGDSKCIPVAQ